MPAGTVTHINTRGEGGDIQIPIPELGKFIPLSEFDARWALFFDCEVREIAAWLPTEVLVAAPHRLGSLRALEPVIPRRARFFSTCSWVLGDRVLDYATLYNSVGVKDFSGTATYSEVYLAEVYEDRGDDGHTDYHMVGHRFVDDNMIKEAEKQPDGLLSIVGSGY